MNKKIVAIMLFFSMLILIGCSNQKPELELYSTENNFTEYDAIEAVKDKYEGNNDIFFVCIDSPDYLEGKKIYQVCVKSESQMEQGGSGTISIIKVNEDGQIIN